MRPEIEKAVSQLKSGGPDGVEQALELLQGTVYAFSMKVCGHREDAEDTAQETLLRTVPQLRNFESPEALGVWLYKVARSRCLMSRRRSKFAPKQHLSLDEVLPDRAELASLLASGGPNPEQHLLRKEDAREMRRALLQIPPQYRQVLVLHDMEELTTGEVAKVTGLRPGTVRVRLHRARAFLRNELAVRPRRRRKPTRPSPACKTLCAALSDYLDQQIDSKLCTRLETHLDACAPCQAYLASLEETVRRCRQHCTPTQKRKIRSDFRQMAAQVLAARE